MKSLCSGQDQIILCVYHIVKTIKEQAFEVAIVNPISVGTLIHTHDTQKGKSQLLYLQLWVIEMFRISSE